jgi:hypothetical protein
MSDKLTRLEINPSPDNPLVKLTTKIEALVLDEPMGLAMSALLSAAHRMETMIRHGNQRAAAEYLARVFRDIARSCEN